MRNGLCPMLDIATGYFTAATLPPSKAGQLPAVQSIHCVKKNMAFQKIIYQLLPPPSRREAYLLLTKQPFLTDLGGLRRVTNGIHSSFLTPHSSFKRGLIE